MRAHVTARTVDGRTFEAEGLMAPLTDRVAFERRFGVTAAVLSRIGDFFNAEGRMRPDADAAALREEWVAFIVFRILARGRAYGEDFDRFLEEVAEVEIEQLAEEAVPFETPSPQPVSSG